jgi:hypothetical protein
MMISSNPKSKSTGCRKKSSDFWLIQGASRSYKDATQSPENLLEVREEIDVSEIRDCHLSASLDLTKLMSSGAIAPSTCNI